MALVTVFELTTMTPEKYQRVIAGLEEAGAGNPEGRLFHVGATTAQGTIVVTDVWESGEKLAAFGEALIPVLQRTGVTPVEPKITEVQGMIFGK